VSDRTEPTERERVQGYVRDTIDIGPTDDYFAVLCEKPDGSADVCHAGNGPNSGWNGAYIARFDPPTLTKLLAVVRAADGIRELLDSGQLVRDISRDTEPGWAMRQLPMVMKLKAFVHSLDALSQRKHDAWDALDNALAACRRLGIGG
jgi:hypothetical protein